MLGLSAGFHRHGGDSVMAVTWAVRTGMFIHRLATATHLVRTVSCASEVQHHLLAERGEREACHLEMLFGKGDADNRDEQQTAEEDMDKA